MAKLILKFNDQVIDHIDIKQGDMKIGRKPGSDIAIDNLAVSGEHASIFTIGEDSFIQDLGSTNGTYIQNKRITKHHLRDGDVVVIGKHSLIYMKGHAEQRAADEFAKTVIIDPGALEAAGMGPDSPRWTRETIDVHGRGAKPEHNGAIFVLSGANSGKRIDLTKAVTNLGKTGRQLGKITRTPDGFVLAPSEGGVPPKLNGRAAPEQGALLKNGDIIEVDGTRLQFYFR